MPTPTATAEPRTPTDLVASVRAARERARAAELELHELALAWADAHPEVAGQEVWHAARPRSGAAPTEWGEPEERDLEEVEWHGIPGVRWDAPAAFAAAAGLSTPAGKAMLRDALVLRHRLPRLHAQVVTGEVVVWRARRVAQAVLGRPADVTTYVDQEVAGRPGGAGSLGPVVLDRIVDEAMLRLYAEQRELAQLEALDAQHATLDERSVGHTGLAEMILRAELGDLKDFDRTLSDVAAALVAVLAEEGRCESLDVRRAMAVGILADPAAALALLGGEAEWEKQCTRRRVDLVVHLTDLALLGFDAVTHRAQPGRPQLVQVVRDWCGRPGTRVTVRPLIDLDEPITRDGYRPSDSQHEHVALRDRHCVFPHCTREATRCDSDHVDPWPPDPGAPSPDHPSSGDPSPGEPGPPGQTDTRNLAPLCRHHHRLKTHAGWRLRVLALGTYLWVDPHGQVFLRTPDASTHDLTQP